MTESKILTLLLAILFALPLSSHFAIAAECVRADPQVTIEPDSLTTLTGSTATYSVKAKNMDTTECSANTFSLTTDIDPSKTFIRPTSLTLEPGETGTFTLEINIPVDADVKTSTLKATVSSGVYTGSDSATLTIKRELITCSLFVDSIALQKSDENTAKSSFIFGDLVRTLTKISLSSKTSENVNVYLYVNGKLFDSKSLYLIRDTAQEFSFDRLINTKDYGISSPTIKVQAKAACDIDGAEKTKTFSIKTGDKCSFSTTVGTPADVTVGDTISTKILFENRGAKDDFVLLQAFVCKEDETDCSGIVCDQTRIDIKKDDIKSVYCSTKASNTGKYRIKANVIACDTQDIQFSKLFNVNPRGIVQAAVACSEGYVDNYRCNGNLVQREYQNIDCSRYWTATDLCFVGCENGKCVGGAQPVVSGQYELKLQREYKAKACDVSTFVFDVENTGETIVNPELSVSGDAAKWIYIKPKISLSANEKKPITVYASVPCDVKAGQYGFTVTAKDGVVYTASSGLSVLPVSVDYSPVVNAIVVVVVIIGVVILNRKFNILKLLIKRKVEEL